MILINLEDGFARARERERRRQVGVTIRLHPVVGVVGGGGDRLARSDAPSSSMLGAVEAEAAVKVARSSTGSGLGCFASIKSP